MFVHLRVPLLVAMARLLLMASMALNYPAAGFAVAVGVSPSNSHDVPDHLNVTPSERREAHDAQLAHALAVVKGGVAAPSLAPAVVNMSATKRDVLLVDVDGDGRADPGDTLRYRVIITSSGDTDAPAVVFNDTIDDNTVFVPGSLRTTPLARNDSYSTVGNVQLVVNVASGVQSNDTDPDSTGGLTVSTFSATSANGGNVSVAADGSFTYNPAPGFSGTDTFTYSVQDADGNHDSAIVSISVGQVVWFINNAVGGPGDGRFTSPLSSIANFNSLAADDPGDYLFVYQGSGAYSGALTLLNSQQLIGHGVGLTIAPNLSIAAASRPTISNVTLASSNTVRGLNINTSGGTGISGGSVGSLTINNVSVTNSGGAGVSLSDGSLAVTFDSISSNGGTNGVNLTSVTGSFTMNGGTIQNSTSHGFNVSNTTGTMTTLTLHNSAFSNAGAGANGVNLAVPLGGSASFTSVNVTNNTFTNNGGTGLRANIQGSGSIGKIDIGSNTFTGNDIGVDLATNGTASLKFDVHNNAPMSGDRTQVNIAANDVTYNNGVGPAMEGHIRNNTITLNPADVGIAVWVVSDGDGNITINVNNNTIAGFGDSGIDVESRGGTGDVHATLTNNTASTSAASPLAGTFLRSGNGTVGETSLLCVNVSNNNMNAGAGAVADYYLDRFNPATTIFQLQGLSPSPATPAQAQAFIITTDSAPPATALAENGTYAAATCNTVSFAGFRASAPASTAGAPPAPLSSDAVVSGKRGLIAPQEGVMPGAPLGPITPLTIGTLPASRAITLTFDVTIDNPVPAGVTWVSNQGTVSGSNFSPVLTDDPDTGTPNDPTVTPLDIAVNLQVTKTVHPIAAYPGLPISYTITYTNTGPQAAANVVITDRVSGALIGVAYQSSATITPTGPFLYVWSIGTLLTGQGGVITVTGAVSPALMAPAIITNTAIITGTGRDTNSNNNTANAVLPVTDRPITGLSATNDSPTPLGSPTIFTATATGSNITYQWNFGDGVLAGEAIAVHTYAAAGAYTAIVSATNSAGLVTATTHVWIFTSRVYLPLVLRN